MIDNRLKYYRMLPLEILELIWDKVSPIAKSDVNKENYLKYYNERINNISENESVERYVRHVIVNDYAFTLNSILTYRFDTWFRIKNYHYGYAVYPNMMHFLHNFCVENSSQKCKQCIVELFQIRGISKNLHKKNRIRNIGWTN